MNLFQSSFAFIEGVGGPELMMIMFIVLLLFGGEKLPQFAKGLGKSIREFKKAASGVEEEIKRAIEEAPDPAPRTIKPPVAAAKTLPAPTPPTTPATPPATPHSTPPATPETTDPSAPPPHY